MAKTMENVIDDIELGRSLTLHETDDVTEGVDEYAELFSGLDSDSGEKVLLYRIAPGSQKQGLLCRLDPGASVEDIPPRFGGGDYIIKRLRGGMIMRSARLYIEGDPIVEKPKVDAATAPVAMPAAPPVDVAALITGMQESNRQLLAGLVQALKPAESEVSMLEKLAMYKNLFAQPAPPNNQMDMLIKGIELARDLSPKPGGETTGMDVVLEAVKSFAPAISDITQRLNAQAQPAPQPVPAQPQLSAPLAEPLQTEPLQTEPEDVTMLKMYLAMLVNHAKNRKDPILYADLIADNLTDAQLDELLSAPDLMAKLGAINPGVLEHRGWFEELERELRAIVSLTDEENADNVTGNPVKMGETNANIGSATDANKNLPARDK